MTRIKLLVIFCAIFIILGNAFTINKIKCFTHEPSSRISITNKKRDSSVLIHKSKNGIDGEETLFENRFKDKKRRSLLYQSLLVTPSFSSITAIPTISNAAEEAYKPAKRALAYLVDSTTPPTLLPLKNANRELSVLRGIGLGFGTSKLSYINESINLNNVVNKLIFGLIDYAKGGDEQRIKENSFVFLGYNQEESSSTSGSTSISLAFSLLQDIIKPRLQNKKYNTAIGLSYLPVTSQLVLDEYIASSSTSFEDLVSLFESKYKVPSNVISGELLPQKSIFQYAKQNNIPLLALCPDYNDLEVVRKEGLQNVDFNRRSYYVADAQGFIQLTQDSKFQLYTDKSMMKEYKQLNEKDTPGDFFAQQILNDETIATILARYTLDQQQQQQQQNQKTLIVTLSPLQQVRFFGGANGRLTRVFNYLKGTDELDDDAITTILCNPTAQSTLSMSRFLRLEIGTSPTNWKDQTKIADYLWFSSMPKVNMIPRMMNPI